VTGQGRIEAGSMVQAWLWPGAGTADHSADEHKVAGIRLTVSDLSAGVGFTINGFPSDPGLAFGTWNVAWRWS
jgi:hypothetical protein